MDVAKILSEGWQRHEQEPGAVASRVAEAIGHATDTAELSGLARLIAHTAAEHVGDPRLGLEALGRIVDHAVFQADTADGRTVWRLLAVLHRLAGNDADSSACAERAIDPAFPRASVHAAVQAGVSSALLSQDRGEEALAALRAALEFARYGPTSDDPAARALAVTGNNLAVELEGRSRRTEEEDELLRVAAATAREMWAVAGGWVEVERAEYRLACTHLALGEPERALEHARSCRSVCEENGADAGERFFAHEAVARCLIASGSDAEARAERDRAAERIAEITDEGFRSYCESSLATLDTTLGITP